MVPEVLDVVHELDPVAVVRSKVPVLVTVAVADSQYRTVDLGKPKVQVKNPVKRYWIPEEYYLNDPLRLCLPLRVLRWKLRDFDLSPQKQDWKLRDFVDFQGCVQENQLVAVVVALDVEVVVVEHEQTEFPTDE